MPVGARVNSRLHVIGRDTHRAVRHVARRACSGGRELFRQGELCRLCTRHVQTGARYVENRNAHES